MLHPYFSFLSGSDFQNSTLHFTLTTGDSAISSAVKVPTCALHNASSWHGSDRAGFFFCWVVFTFCLERKGWLMKPC